MDLRLRPPEAHPHYVLVLLDRDDEPVLAATYDYRTFEVLHPTRQEVRPSCWYEVIERLPCATADEAVAYIMPPRERAVGE